MLGPYCETEAAAPVIRDLGLRSIDALARDLSRARSCKGTLVVAARARPGRDRSLRAADRGPPDARMQQPSARWSPISPAASRRACSMRGEGHVAPRRGDALPAGGGAARRRRGCVRRDRGPRASDGADMVIDCRGLGARGELADLRGVRGERFIVRTREIDARPARCACCIRASRSTSCRGATAAHAGRHRHRERRRRAP